MTFGKTLKICRKEKGYTQQDLAELIGVSMQAISKWETDAGMPDISQIVPLAKVLNVSADRLLGITEDNSDTDLSVLRQEVGHYTLYAFGKDNAKRIYDLTAPFFMTHPTNPEVALWCLDSLTELIAKNATDKPIPALLTECERYGNCIFRYETDADDIFRTYYVMSRAYRLLGDTEKSETMSDRMPEMFGDKTYWEAEYAFADGDMKTALQKCKESFADKARFISRCIRLARMISERNANESAAIEQIELNEYMLRLINAFLSGGDYMSYRQVYQKTSLLSGMTGQYAKLGNRDKALSCLNQLIETRNDFFEFLKHPADYHCLMFIEGDDDASWHATKENINGYVLNAKEKLLKAFPDIDTALIHQ